MEDQTVIPIAAAGNHTTQQAGMIILWRLQAYIVPKGAAGRASYGDTPKASWLPYLSALRFI